MSWLIWRQHRQQALFGTATLGLLALLLLLTGLHMHSVFHDSGLGRCLTSRHPDCSNLQSAFESRFSTLRQLVPFFMVLPALLGLFWGAPLIGRELEQGTHLFVWTQGVTRSRWLTSKLAALLALTLLLTVSYALLISWWLGPLNRSTGDRFQPGIFDQQGLVPVAYAVFALALGIAAGAVLKRTMPAMAATLVGFVGLRLIVAGLVRRHFIAPVKSSYVPLPGADVTHPGAWVFSQHTYDAAGRVVPDFDVRRPVRRARTRRPRRSTAASAPTDSSTPMSSSRRAASGSFKASRPPSSADSHSLCSRSPSGGCADVWPERRRLCPSPRLSLGEARRRRRVVGLPHALPSRNHRQRATPRQRRDLHSCRSASMT